MFGAITAMTPLPRRVVDPVSTRFPMPRSPRLALQEPVAGRRAPPPAQVVAPRRRLRFRLLRWAIIAAIWGTLAAAAVLLWFARDLPRPEAALDAFRRPSLDAGGSRRPRHSPRSATWWASRCGWPTCRAYLPAAAVAVEDRRFWHHPGIDLIGLARAAVANLISPAASCRAAPPSPSRSRRTCS